MSRSVHFESNQFILNKEPRKPGKGRREMALSHETLTERIMAAAIEFDRRPGAGFLESVYEKARIIANASTATEAAKVNEIDHRVAKECVGRGAIFEFRAIRSAN